MNSGEVLVLLAELGHVQDRDLKPERVVVNTELDNRAGSSTVYDDHVLGQATSVIELASLRAGNVKED